MNQSEEYQDPRFDYSGEPPITIEDDGHDKRVEIVEEECSHCGYDRCKLVAHSMAGVYQLTCQACGWRTNDGIDEWLSPTTEFDQLRDLRDWAENEGPVEKVGEIGGSRFTHGTEIFEHSDCGLLKIFEHPSSTSTERTTISKDDLRDLVTKLQTEQDFLVETIEELDELERALIAAKALPDEFEIQLTDDEE